jgi:hypothetical protein
VTAAELEVLRRRALGETDSEIGAALNLKFSALRSRLRRFGDRTDLVHLRLVAWCARHVECCLGDAV